MLSEIMIDDKSVQYLAQLLIKVKETNQIKSSNKSYVSFFQKLREDYQTVFNYISSAETYNAVALGIIGTRLLDWIHQSQMAPSDSFPGIHWGLAICHKQPSIAYVLSC